MDTPAVTTVQPNIQLWVKTKDEVEREVQRWNHVYLHDMAVGPYLD